MTTRKKTKEQKSKISFWAGLTFLAIGFWMIFIVKDNLGFLPGILGTLLIFWRY